MKVRSMTRERSLLGVLVLWVFVSVALLGKGCTGGEMPGKEDTRLRDDRQQVHVAGERFTKPHGAGGVMR